MAYNDRTDPEGGGSLPSAPPQPGAPPAPGMFGFTGASWFNPDDPWGSLYAFLSTHPAGPQALIQLKPELEKYGFQLESPNAAGIVSKVSRGGEIRRMGDYFDGGGTPAWNRGVVQPGAGGGDGGAPGIDPSYLAPWTEDFNFQGFDQPNKDTILQDPSYQFRLDQGLGALQNSAAAKGLLHSGGTLGEIMDQGQNFASQEYGNIWNRNFGLWDRNRNNAFQQFQDRRDTFYKNQENPYSKILRAAQLGAGMD